MAPLPADIDAYMGLTNASPVETQAPAAAPVGEDAPWVPISDVDAYMGRQVVDPQATLDAPWVPISDVDAYMGRQVVDPQATLDADRVAEIEEGEEDRLDRTLKRAGASVDVAADQGAQALPPAREALRSIRAATLTRDGESLVEDSIALEEIQEEAGMPMWYYVGLQPGGGFAIAYDKIGKAFGEGGTTGEKVEAVATGMLGFLPIASLIPHHAARMIGAVQGDKQAAKELYQSPLTKIGQIQSTLQRPPAALARALLDNTLAGKTDPRTGKPYADPDTGEPIKAHSFGEVFDELLEAANPIPQTRRADVSWTDVIARISLALGGTGTGLKVIVPGAAIDVLLDPATYVSFGGTSTAKASQQIQRIAFKGLVRAGATDAAAKSTKFATYAMQTILKSGKGLDTAAPGLFRMLEEIADPRAAQELVDLGSYFGKYGARVVGPLGKEGAGVLALPFLAEDALRGGVGGTIKKAGEVVEAWSDKAPGKLAKLLQGAGKKIQDIPDILPLRRQVLDFKGFEVLPADKWAYTQKAIVEQSLDAAEDIYTAVSKVWHPGRDISDIKSGQVLEAIQGLRRFWSTGPSLLETSSTVRAMHRVAANNMDEAHQATSQAVSTLTKFVRGAHRTESEWNTAGRHWDTPYRLAAERVIGIGIEERGLYGRMFDIPLSNAKEMDKALGVHYARAIINAGSPAEAQRLFTYGDEALDMLPAAEYVAGAAGKKLAQTRPDLGREIRRGVRSVAGGVAGDFAKTESEFAKLDDGLKTIGQAFGVAMEAMHLEREAMGIPQGHVERYLPHVYREKDRLIDVMGVGKADGASAEQILKHRKYISAAQGEAKGLNPVWNLAQVWAAQIYAHNRVTLEYRTISDIVEMATDTGSIKALGKKMTQPHAVAIANKMRDEGKLIGRRGEVPGVLKHGDDWFVVHPEVEDAVKHANELLTPERMGLLGRTASVVQAWWKTRATSGRLGFHTRNFWSNLVMMHAGGWSGRHFGRSISVGLIGHLETDTSDLVKAARKGATIGKGDAFFNGVADATREKLVRLARIQAKKTVSDSAGNVWTYKDLYDEAFKRGVIDKGWISGDISGTAMKEIAQSQEYGLGRHLMKLNPFSNKSIPIVAGNKAGRYIENHARLTLFLDRVLTHGDSTRDAGNVVKRWLFDYKDLSKADRKIKQVVPFWTWLRKNLPSRVLETITQPGRGANVLSKVKRASDKHYRQQASDAQWLSEQNMPDYIRRSMGLRMPWSAVPLPGFDQVDNGSMMILDPDVPHRDLNILSLDFDGLISQMTPFLKVPVELLRGKQFWNEREFGTVEVPSHLQLFFEALPDELGGWVKEKEDEDGTKTMVTSGRLLYLLQATFPDLFTWHRLFFDEPKDALGREKLQSRRMADLTGILRTRPVRPARLQERSTREATKKLRSAIPGGSEFFKE